MPFLARILNRPVFDVNGSRLGWVDDLILTSIDLFPKVEAFVLARRGQGAIFLPWEMVATIDATGLRLLKSRNDLSRSPLDDTAIFLRRDILDKQIVDTHGHKVVRVNDLQLVEINHELRLTGADISMRGLLRRLNIDAPILTLSQWVHISLPERIIPWNYVESLETEWASVRLNVSHRRLRELPVTDIADILEQLHPYDREDVVQQIDDETLAGALPYLEEDTQAELIMSLSDERASDIMEILPPDEAADVLGDISEERAERILHLMDADEADDVRVLMRYDDDTAGGLMTTEFMALSDTLSSAEAIATLREKAPQAETIYYIYMVDTEGHLEGVLSLRDLITAQSDEPIEALARSNVIRVNTEDDQETVARTLNHYHLLAVPVVDEQNVLLGIVTVDDVLDILHEEAEEDISRASGSVEGRDTLVTSWEQASSRLPWVLVATLAGLLTTLYLILQHIAGFWDHLPILFALLPLITLLGTHIGGICAATVQIGMTEDEDVKEILLGLAHQQWPIGLGFSIIGALVGGAIISAQGLTSVALIGGSAVFLLILLSLLAGSFLPLVLRNMKLDPLIVSRPALAVLLLLIEIPLLTMMTQ